MMTHSVLALLNQWHSETVLRHRSAGVSANPDGPEPGTFVEPSKTSYPGIGALCRRRS